MLGKQQTMENYEEFCFQSLLRLQGEEKLPPFKGTCRQQGALSTIQFYGRAVLLPVLNEEQRKEMVQCRLRAVQIDMERQSLRKENISSRVQETAERLQKHKKSPGSSCFENNFPHVPDVALTPSGDTSASFRKTETTVHKQDVLEDLELQVVKEKEDGSLCVSLQNLLKRSREYLEKEQGHRGSRGTSKSSPTVTESLSDKENKIGDDVGEGLLSNSSHQLGFESNGCPESLPGIYLRSHGGPHPHRRRPRPISTGSILSIPPMSPSESSPEGPGAKLPEVDAVATSVERRLPDSLGSGDRVPSSGTSGQPGSLSRTSLTWTPVPSTMGPSINSSEFRRRSNTLDSHLSFSHLEPPVDRSRERVPRMMGGVVWKGVCQRSPPTPLRRASRGAPEPLFMQSTSSLEMEASQGSYKSPLAARLLTSRKEVLEGESGGVQSHIHVLETKHWKLEEDHARQLSVLITEQEKAQERLHQLDEKEKRLRECGDELVMDLGVSWNAPKEICCPLSPSHPTQFPTERSPGGNASSISPGIPAPAVHSPIYLWGPPVPSKAWYRMSQVLTPEQQCRLGAVARGFLTRRLLNTEKLKHLRQTVQDTQDFIRSFQTEAPIRKGSLSPQDIALQDRVKAQLRAALYDVHDIFFEMPLQDRLALLQQDRELRAERKLREMEKARSPKDKVTLSAATQKSLDRKKQRVGESPGSTKKGHQKTKSPPKNRVLQPSQGQNAPVAVQLLRQGSLYRKTPEERVKHSDNMRKRHSLG